MFEKEKHYFTSYTIKGMRMLYDMVKVEINQTVVTIEELIEALAGKHQCQVHEVRVYAFEEME